LSLLKVIPAYELLKSFTETKDRFIQSLPYYT